MTTSPHEGAAEIDVEVATVMRAARVFAGVTAESIAQAGDLVTPPQLRVLVLASSQEPLNTSGVAAALDVHLSNASRICDRLVVAGLLNRRDSPADRRTVELTLTDQGAELVETVLAHRRAAFHRILRRMAPPERVTLISGLDALCDAAGDYTVPGLD